MTRDANNSFTMLIQKMASTSPNSKHRWHRDAPDHRRATLRPTNGMVTMTITTPLQGICQ